ncbi:phospholipid transporting ATPase [Tieghemiomyces parasiticus]|uniref:Phospholipid-transporting ATPase n=1 Tax=Tieghemiomyces parasiticus TaxID=78921 RepID=A0A9W8A8Y3_9FUNG|nr:phospholipid transporting ATPase [Tieghemiomyces parasiticus]
MARTGWGWLPRWARRGDHHSGPEEKPGGASGYERRIFLNTPLPPDAQDPHGNPSRIYVSNEVITTKYTLITFLPKNLFEQFRRVANLYFLFLIILQVIPAVAEGSAALSALALLFIVFVTAVKDGYEDWKRYQSDAEVNNAKTQVLKRWTNFNTARSHEHQGLWARIRGCLPSQSEPDPATLHRSRSALRPSPDLSGSIVSSGEKLGAGHGLDDPAQWARTQWRFLNVGDLVLIRNDQAIPADVLVLSTSDPDGLCYVETKNLDGETNLKLRQAMGSTTPWQSLEDVRSAELHIDCEVPNTNLYSFKGTMSVTARGSVAIDNATEPKGPCKEPVSIDNILLRGCILRNTEYAVGLVLFTGAESKIVLNSGITPSKRSRIEKVMNTQVALNFVLLFILCLLCAISDGFLYTQDHTSQALFETRFDVKADSPAFMAFLTFWAGLILFQNIVPISLYISIELVKTLQAYFIYCDLDMYYPALDRPCMPKTWNISDDLGQVQYVFSDKTGTLTQNVMEFRQCSIRGTVYGELFSPDSDNEDDGGEPEGDPLDVALELANHGGQPTIPTTPGAFVSQALTSPSRLFNGSDVSHKASQSLRDIELEARTPTSPRSSEPKPNFEEAKRTMLDDMQAMFDNRYFDHEDVTFVDTKLFRHLSADDSQARGVVEFFTILAVCHSVLAERPDPDQPNKIVYKAQSPDEAALVSAARNAGFAFLGREQETVRCEFLGRPQEFRLLNVLEFNSTRKRMSVVVQRTDGRIVLFSKGADSIIFQRLRAGQVRLKEQTLEHLKYFATSGLRTLCLGYRIIPAAEYDAWAVEYHAASNLLDGREEAIDAACERLEHSLTLVGGTAIEDRLQDGVPEAIAQLALAGLKIWVLTGDKTETAINIGFSCNLLHDAMQLVVVAGSDAESTETQLREALELFGHQQGRIRGPHPTSDSIAALKTDHDHQASRGVDGSTPGLEADGRLKPLALVIDGDSLKHALDPAREKLFLQVAQMCEAVICCRVSPLQKALVVRCVKSNLNVLCLAIGDGANDVSMIQEADIGVGIAGEEGLQAVLASDYSIAQFRYLQKLLLVHGRWSYLRVANMILIFFYKNIIFTFALFWYQIYCGFSLTFLFDYALMMFYNLAFTSIPVLILGILDQDVSAEVSMAVPQLYLSGIRGTEYNMRRFWLHVFDGIYQSLVCVLIPFYTYSLTGSAHMSGLDDAGLNEVGTVIAVAVVCVSNLYVALNTLNWTWIIPTVVTLSTLCLTLFLGIYCQLRVSPLYQMDAAIYTQGNFYFILALVIILSMLPRFFIKFVRQAFTPSDSDLVREVVYLYARLRKSSLGVAVGPHADGKVAAANVSTAGGSRGLLGRRRGESDATVPMSPQCMPLTAPHATSMDSPDSLSIRRGTTLPGSGAATPTTSILPDGDLDPDHPPELLNHLQRMASISSVGGASSIRRRGSARLRRTSTRRGPFVAAMSRLKAKTIYFMKTGKTQPNTGFAYSQHHQSALSVRYSHTPSLRSIQRLPSSDADLEPGRGTRPFDP